MTINKLYNKKIHNNQSYEIEMIACTNKMEVGKVTEGITSTTTRLSSRNQRKATSKSSKRSKHSAPTTRFNIAPDSKWLVVQFKWMSH